MPYYIHADRPGQADIKKRQPKEEKIMEFLKSIFTNIDFHLNAQTKTLTITYGENHISLRLTEDGKVRFDTNLVLDGPSAKAIEAETK